MALYKTWCTSKKVSDKRKHYWTYAENAGGRKKVQLALLKVVRSHYRNQALVAKEIKELGYLGASRIMKLAMPQSATARSGDLGEILATELVEEDLGHRVPVRRLRYKDGRNNPMRGDDFIGAGYDADDALWLLKGESKSYASLSKNVVTLARAALNRDHGRCAPDALLFVATRLLESSDSEDQELGADLVAYLARTSKKSARVDHMLFTLTGNAAPASLKADLDAASTTREQYVVNLHIPDHQAFIAAVFARAQKLGKP